MKRILHRYRLTDTRDTVLYAFHGFFLSTVSCLNLFIPTFKFRMTTVKTVRRTLRQGWYLASIDLKDAYWHVPIARSFRPYLAFSAGGDTYQFCVLPFGLNIAPRVFSKSCNPSTPDSPISGYRS